MLDLRQIRCFMAVADAGNFVRAAADLRVSQPALSKTIRLLEKAIDAKLFERGARRVTLTASGKILYDYGKAILAEVARAESELHALRNAPGGSISVGSLRTVANLLLPEVTTRFIARFPAVRIRIVENYNADLVNGLVRGDFDFIIGIADGNISERGFLYEPLCYDHLVLVARCGHALAKKKQVTPADLTKESWILPRSGTLLRKRLDEMFYEAGTTPPKASLESGSLQYMRSLLVQSDYLALLPEYSIRAELELGILSVLNFDSPFLWRPIGLIFHPNHVLPQACKALIEEIRVICKARGMDKKRSIDQLATATR